MLEQNRNRFGYSRFPTCSNSRMTIVGKEFGYVIFDDSLLIECVLPNNEGKYLRLIRYDGYLIWYRISNTEFTNIDEGAVPDKIVRHMFHYLSMIMLGFEQQRQLAAQAIETYERNLPAVKRLIDQREEIQAYQEAHDPKHSERVKKLAGMLMQPSSCVDGEENKESRTEWKNRTFLEHYGNKAYMRRFLEDGNKNKEETEGETSTLVSGESDRGICAEMEASRVSYEDEVGENAMCDTMGEETREC